MGPGRCLFEFGGEPEKREFVSKASYELNADRKASLVPVQRHIDRRLPSHILHCREWYIVNERREGFVGIALIHVEGTKLDRRQSQRRRQPDVIGFMELGREPA